MSAIKTFTEGKIFSPLLRFSMPILFALLLQAMYGAVDLLIIGQFCSSADVSAVATGSQIMQTITSVITGLAMGTTILLAGLVIVANVVVDILYKIIDPRIKRK